MLIPTPDPGQCVSVVAPVSTLPCQYESDPASRQRSRAGSRAKHCDDGEKRLRMAIGPASGVSTDAALQEVMDELTGRGTAPYVQLLHLRGRSDAAACGRRWGREVSTRGDDCRWRLIGCGDRGVCPSCAGYYHRMQGADAWELFEGVAAGAQARGIELDHVFSAHWMTLPKLASRALHKLFWRGEEGRARWKSKVDALYIAAREVVKSVTLDGIAPGLNKTNRRKIKVGGVGVMHAFGSANPVDPHYHFITLMAPIAWVEGTWVSLDARWSPKQLADMKKLWTEKARAILDDLVNFDSLLPASGLLVCRREPRELDDIGKAIHTVVYELRAPLQDLWSGMGSDLSYEWHDADDRRFTRVLESRELGQLIDDVSGMRSAMRRVRWFGFLSGKRADYLPSLGFVKSEPGDEDELAWRPCGVFKLVTADVERGVVVMERYEPAPERAPNGDQLFQIERYEVSFETLALKASSPVGVHSAKGKWVWVRDG